MRKILVVALALIAIGIVTASAVSAEGWNFSFGSESNSDGGSISVENNKLKIQDEDFTIPDGYQENEKSRILAQDSPDFKGAKVSGAIFLNGDKNITVKVIYGDNLGINLTADPADGGENKTIGDHNGVLVTGEGVAKFSYVDGDDKFIQIAAPSEAEIQTLLK